VVQPLAALVIRGEIAPGAVVQVGVRDNALRLAVQHQRRKRGPIAA
jgi:hypothetical protein